MVYDELSFINCSVEVGDGGGALRAYRGRTLRTEEGPCSSSTVSLAKKSTVSTTPRALLFSYCSRFVLVDLYLCVVFCVHSLYAFHECFS